MSQLDTAPGGSLTAHVIFVRYFLFAVVSGLANVAAQETVVLLSPAAPIMVSILVGTGIGFFVKYLLEKKWVFFDAYDGHAAELRKLFVYGLFGVGTTLFFWAVELGFWQVFQTVEGKHLGAVIGLSIGNWIKYLLDKHFVFAKASS